MADNQYHVANVVQVNEGNAVVEIADKQFPIPLREDVEIVPASKIILTLVEKGEMQYDYEVSPPEIQENYKKQQRKAELQAQKEAEEKARQAEAKRLERRRALVASYFEAHTMVKEQAPEGMSDELIKDVATHIHIEFMKKGI